MCVGAYLFLPGHSFVLINNCRDLLITLRGQLRRSRHHPRHSSSAASSSLLLLLVSRRLLVLLMMPLLLLLVIQCCGRTWEYLAHCATIVTFERFCRIYRVAFGARPLQYRRYSAHIGATCNNLIKIHIRFAHDSQWLRARYRDDDDSLEAQ